MISQRNHLAMPHSSFHLQNKNIALLQTPLCRSNHGLHSRARRLFRVCPAAKSTGSDVSNAHISILLAAAVSLSAVSPAAAVLPVAGVGRTHVAANTSASRGEQIIYRVLNSPGVHAATLVASADRDVVQQQQQQQEQQQNEQEQEQEHHADTSVAWYLHDADVWQELTTPAEVTAFMSSVQPPPAWPALSSDHLSPKLRLIEFYAGWCPACKAAAPGLAAVARDPSLTAVCSFARANVDRVKPLLKQLGISRIPAALLLDPSGQVLDTVRANGQVVRDAILVHAAAITQGLPPAALEGLPPPPPSLELPSPAEEPPPSEVNASNSSSNSSSAAPARASDGPAACSTAPDVAAACGLLPPGFNGGAAQPGGATTAAAAAAGTGSAAAAGAAAADSGGGSLADAAGHMSQAKQQFLKQHKAAYGYQGWLEQHYQQEVGARLGPGQHYLDYTGAALYPTSLLDAVYSDLLSHTYGNPHSAAAAGLPSSLGSASSSPAAASAQVLEEAALAVLAHLNADPAEYQVVFTRSATEALKLVGEMFPWSAGGTYSSAPTSNATAPPLGEKELLPNLNQSQPPGSSGSSSSSRFIYTRSNHNSVLGIGGYAAAAGAKLQAMSDQEMTGWLDPAEYQHSFPQQQQQQQQQVQQSTAADVALDQLSGAPAAAEVHYSLVAYPAQDNFAGVMYPLQWINQAHAASNSSERFLVLLDAAAFLPTHPLDLTAYPADFVCASFYKMFGYPTGLGALVLRTELVPLLNKVYFGGGSVALATPEGCWHVGKCDPAAALTDGTPNYLGAAAVVKAYEQSDARGGVQAIEQHTQALQAWLYKELSSLHHSNGAPLVQLYGHHHSHEQQRGFGQGAVFNFQVLRADGSPISYSRVEREAEAAGLSLRSGCVCNPGACYDSLGLTAQEVQALAGLKEGCGDDMDFITVMRPAAAAGGGGGYDDEQQLHEQQVPLGSVRASLGWASTFEDAAALVSFLIGYRT